MDRQSQLPVFQCGLQALLQEMPHRGYIKRKELKQPAGLHFNKKGHGIEDLVAVAIEKVMPTGDHELRKCREKYWINNYDSVHFGGNSRE